MEYHMLYVKSRKNFKMRREKKFITLPYAKKSTRKIYYFAVCKKKKDCCAPK